MKTIKWKWFGVTHHVHFQWRRQGHGRFSFEVSHHLGSVCMCEINAILKS